VQYRPDIDGLRGIAVVAVMLFHFGVPGFTGGFTGVDVFFVISGYLITSLIFPEIASGRFSFAEFYERRLRRLIPALLAVVAFSWLAGICLLEPHDLRYLHQSVIATVLFAANFLFWQTTGYFDIAADTRPLLHAWSLAVEEQFYVAFPVILVLAARCAPRHVCWLIFGGAVVSLAASVLFTTAAPTASYYLLPFRFWELALGALLALRQVELARLPQIRNAAGIAGFVLVGYAIFALSRDTPYPGVAALVPCAGTALLIIAGLNGGCGFSRLLAIRPLVFTGLISYSLYLWHWPLLVYARYVAIRELTALETAALLMVSCLVAIASWRYVELPFRGSRGLMSRPMLFRTAAVSSVVFISVGSAGLYGERPAVEEATAGVGRTLAHQHCLNLNVSAIAQRDLCVLGAAGGASPSFLLWGDSHAGALAPALERAAARAGRAGLFAGQAGCVPLLGVERHDRRDLPCREFNDGVARMLAAHPEIRTVFLAARWAMYLEGTRPENGSSPKTLISRDGVAGNAGAFEEGLRRTLHFLEEQRRQVIFVTEPPEIGWDVPTVIARSRASGKPLPAIPPLAAQRTRQRNVARAVMTLSRNYPLKVVDLPGALCPQGDCLVERGGRPLYIDSNHLSAHGCEFVANAFAGTF